jgi:hypothetical protein
MRQRGMGVVCVFFLCSLVDRVDMCLLFVLSCRLLSLFQHPQPSTATTTKNNTTCPVITKKTMKLPSNNLIPYLSVGFFIPTATAFIEPEASTQTVVAQASFVVTSALPPPNTVFYQLSDAKVPNSLTSDFLTLEQNLGIDPGVSMIDGRSGKVANLFLQKPIFPGSGQENNLLWSVGVSGGDDAGAPSSSEEWSEIGVKAFKVRYWHFSVT